MRRPYLKRLISSKPSSFADSAGLYMFLGLLLSNLLVAWRATLVKGEFPFLWAEDTTVFLGGSHSGAVSLLAEYAGYLHLWPRIFALVADLLPLEQTPFIFLFGWWASFNVFLIVFIRFLQIVLEGLKWPIFAMSGLIALVPSNDVFFTLTNSQWWLGASLFVFFLTLFFSKSKTTRADPIFVLLFGLTGPFSIFVLIAIIPSFLIKPTVLKSNAISIFALAFSCIVQVFFIFSSGRLQGDSARSTGIGSTDLLGFFSTLILGNSGQSKIVMALIALAVLFGLYSRRSLIFSDGAAISAFGASILFMAVSTAGAFVGAGRLDSELASWSSRYNLLPLVSTLVLLLLVIGRQQIGLSLLAIAIYVSFMPRVDVLPIQESGWRTTFNAASDIGEVSYRGNPFWDPHFWFVVFEGKQGDDRPRESVAEFDGESEWTADCGLFDGALLSMTFKHPGYTRLQFSEDSVPFESKILWQPTASKLERVLLFAQEARGTVGLVFDSGFNQPTTVEIFCVDLNGSR